MNFLAHPHCNCHARTLSFTFSGFYLPKSHSTFCLYARARSCMCFPNAELKNSWIFFFFFHFSVCMNICAVDSNNFSLLVVWWCSTSVHHLHLMMEKRNAMSTVRTYSKCSNRVSWTQSIRQPQTKGETSIGNGAQRKIVQIFERVKGIPFPSGTNDCKTALNGRNNNTNDKQIGDMNGLNVSKCAT